MGALYSQPEDITPNQMRDKIIEFNYYLQNYAFGNPRLAYYQPKGFPLARHSDQPRCPRDYLHRNGKLRSRALRRYGFAVKHAIISNVRSVWRSLPMDVDL